MSQRGRSPHAGGRTRSGPRRGREFGPARAATPGGRSSLQPTTSARTRIRRRSAAGDDTSTDYTQTRAQRHAFIRPRKSPWTVGPARHAAKLGLDMFSRSPGIRRAGWSEVPRPLQGRSTATPDASMPATKWRHSARRMSPLSGWDDVHRGGRMPLRDKTIAASHPVKSGQDRLCSRPAPPPWLCFVKI